MSLETLELFRELMGMVTLNVGAPDFSVQAERMMKARAELETAIDSHAKRESSDI